MFHVLSGGRWYVLSVGHKRLRTLLNFFCLILPSVREHLYRRCPLQTDYFEQSETVEDVLLCWLSGEVIEDGIQSTGILDGLSTSLSLIYEPVSFADQSRQLRLSDLRGSIAWAASPTKTSRPLVQLDKGSRYNKGHRLMLVA